MSFLTHISLLWDIGKENSRRCDAADLRRPIWGYSVCTEKFHRKLDKKIKITQTPLKMEVDSSN